MTTVTERDVLMMAAPIAGGYIANPCNNIAQHDPFASTEAFRVAIEVVTQSLTNRGVTIITDPFQEAVVDAANKG